ncbi:MAG TPA: S-layer homology domain-containing protein [Thermoanaerobaculia bacterium]
MFGLRVPDFVRATGLAALLLSAAAADSSAQSVDEFPLPSGGIPQDLTAGPDGNLWFTEITQKIGRVTPAGVVTEFPVAGGPLGITEGPDGALWFAENTAAKIGRMTVDGATYTEFPLAAGHYPTSIEAGPDGALWFTETNANKIGRITTAGVVTEFSIPTANSGPHAIAAGPDGNLWFTENGKNKIGRLTTAGVFTEFPIPTAGSFPEGITAGPDGNLWFAENVGAKIGRVTTAGVITEFPLPEAGRVFHIAGGPDGNVWFTEFDNNRISKIEPDGTITRYLIPTSGCGAYGIGLGADGKLWFTEFHTARVGRLDLAGTPPPQIDFELPLPGGSLPEDAATGSDGNVWFVDVNKIGRITPAGVVTKFTIPSAGAFPQGIASGPDGALWFSENSANKIGRITTAGAFTDEFPVPTSASAPQGIAAGPDGALWFTEFNADKIGRSTLSGAMTEHPVPTAGGEPMRIAAGSDGNLWFTERGKNKIGRLTPGGVFDEFPIPTANVYPEGITAGADGSLWFAENAGNAIGRITTAGVITEFPLPEPGRVFHIVGGPDGNLWFTEFDNNKIGRITTAGTISQFLIPTADSRPYGITPLDRSYQLWFSEFNKAKFGVVGVGAPTLTVSSVSPTSGPSVGATPASIAGAGFDPDVTVLFGLSAAAGVSGGGGEATCTTPPLPPGALYDVVATNPDDGSFGVLERGWMADFLDVPQAHVFHAYIEKLFRNGITAGCGNGDFCPEGSVTRAQMAVFLLKAEHGADYVPPPCGGIFPDVPCPATPAFPYSDWIERLFAEGITVGCGSGYCPADPVTRAQMAVFLLKTEHGSGYTPPDCTGIFADVQCPGDFAVDFIERLYAEQITGGCLTNPLRYCPDAPNARGEMAVFLVKTFGLP